MLDEPQRCPVHSTRLVLLIVPARATTLDGELFWGPQEVPVDGRSSQELSVPPRLEAAELRGLRLPLRRAPAPFEDRMNVLAKLFPAESKPAHVHVVEQTLCKGAAHIEAELKRVEDVGGEGLMLREAAEQVRALSLLNTAQNKEYGRA